MIKGHVQIDIHNHNSGFTERYEQDNMVTDALKYVIPNYIGANRRPNDEHGIMPLATRALGGLMLFDGPLTEDAKNIHFPSEAHLVAYAGQDVNTSSIRRGSKNSAESKAIATGYQTVWDFGTSQANGSIQSLALTNYWINPFESGDINVAMHQLMSANGDRTTWYPYPIAYDEKNQEIYYMEGGFDNWQYNDDKRNYSHNITWNIYKEYVPTNRYKVADSGNDVHYPEAVASCSIQYEGQYEYIAPWENFYNGYDGYAYYVWCDGNTSGNASVTYWRMKIDDFSFKIDDPVTISVANCALAGGISAAMINKGYLYMGGRSSRYIYVVNLADPVQVRTVDLGEGNWYEQRGNSSGGAFIGRYNGGIKFILTTNNSSSNSRYYYSRALLYPDGLVVADAPFYEGTGYPDYQNDNRPMFESDNLLMWGRHYSWAYNCAFAVTNYLGTICNLSSAVQKTAASSMKVTYTLTDVDDTEETTA